MNSAVIVRHCFLCDSKSIPVKESAWSWSQPRSLCPQHKCNLQLDDGCILEDLLTELQPPGHALEGNLLGWILNPVFVPSADREKVMVWIDFSAGGMAAFEIRFAAKHYFEFRAMECSHAVDLLYTIQTAEEHRFFIASNSLAIP